MAWKIWALFGSGCTKSLYADTENLTVVPGVTLRNVVVVIVGSVSPGGDVGFVKDWGTTALTKFAVVLPVGSGSPVVDVVFPVLSVTTSNGAY